MIVEVPAVVEIRAAELLSSLIAKGSSILTRPQSAILTADLVASVNMILLGRQDYSLNSPADIKMIFFVTIKFFSHVFLKRVTT